MGAFWLPPWYIFLYYWTTKYRWELPNFPAWEFSGWGLSRWELSCMAFVRVWVVWVGIVHLPLFVDKVPEVFKKVWKNWAYFLEDYKQKINLFTVIKRIFFYIFSFKKFQITWILFLCTFQNILIKEKKISNFQKNFC